MNAQTRQDAPAADASTIAHEHADQVQALFDLARDMLCVASLEGVVTLLNPA